MFPLPESGVRPFVIVCKSCRHNIPASVETLPGSWIVAVCPLCGDERRYLPADIFPGKLSPDLLTRSGQPPAQRR
jgi:hypothetical protein